MPSKRPFILLLVFILTVSLATAAPIVHGDGPEDFSLPEKQELQYPNLGSHLNQLVAAVEQGQLSAKQAAADSPIHSGGSVAVTIHLSGSVEDVVDFLAANGGDPRNVGEDYIEAYVLVTLLGRLSQQPGVTRVWEIIPPQPAYGNVTSQAVSLHQADSWQNAGFRGQGVKVGVIDVGFTGYSGLMGVELPANVVARCYTDVGVFSGNLAGCEAEGEPPASIPSQCREYVERVSAGGEPHGTAVAESLIDIAPDATLYIANPLSWGDLQETAAWMAEQGVTVINYSVGWVFHGPGDGTSPFSSSPFNTVDQAVAGGITWVNSAGNSAGDTWLGRYSDPEGNGVINFDDSTAEISGIGPSVAEINPIALRECRSYTFLLRWDDSWDAAVTDLDIYLWDRSTGGILNVPRAWGYVGGAAPQSGASGDIPLEIFSLRSPIDSDDVGVIIVHDSGPVPDWIHLELFRGPGGLGYATDGGSIGTPAESANPGLLAVGAAHYWETDTAVTSYSSRGPTPDGRVKPDIVGTDCGETVSYPRYLRGSHECWFSGTSQASPHVAGLAALVKQRFPEFAPDQVADYLKHYAEQREAPDPNNTWGHGFAVLPPPPDAEPPLGFDTSCGQTITADSTVSGQWATGCNSETPAPGPGSGARLARYYSFNLDQESEVTITLTRDSGDTDTYLYLREGQSRSGAALHENDDDGSDTTRSKIRETLPAGAYTIEATTYSPGYTGSFTLAVSSSGGTATPPAQDNCIETITADGGTATGQWAANDCLSQEREGRYARYYTFELTGESEVTITLESDDADAYLYLRQGNAQSGTALNDHAADDDAGGGRYYSKVEETLAADTYTIEATTFSVGETGSFTLRVTSISATPTPDDCIESLADVGASTEGAIVVNTQWDSECESKVRLDSYARYYTFTPEQESEVTITLSSEDADTYLYLRQGVTRTGAVLHENDNHQGSASVSQIQATLPAGRTYTIEATTKNPKETGSFTLTFSAEQVRPARFAGNAFIDGHKAPDGTLIEALSDGTVVGTATAQVRLETINYILDVARPSGSLALTFRVGGHPAREEATWQDGAVTYPFNLNASTATLPTSDCAQTIAADGTVSGEWIPGCESETPAPGAGSGARLARYYTFTLDQYYEVTIALNRDSGNADTYLYLRKDDARSGEALHYNDDDGGDTTKSKIQGTLSPGTYTVEATTYQAGQTGTFTLTLTVVGFDGGRVPVAIVLAPLGDNLLWVAHYDNPTATWSVYDPSDTFSPSELPFPGGADSGPIGDLTHMVHGAIYWIKVIEEQTVTLGGVPVTLDAGVNLITFEIRGIP